MEIKTKTEAGRPLVFDHFRGRWVAHTPEEGVRQWFCCWLVNEKGYPQTSIATETGLKLNGSLRRCDTVVYKAGVPAILIEFKAPDVEINSSVLLQAVSYNTKLRAPYIILTNSKQLYCLKLDFVNGKHEYLSAVPDFNELTVDI